MVSIIDMEAKDAKDAVTVSEVLAVLARLEFQSTQAHGRTLPSDENTHLSGREEMIDIAMANAATRLPNTIVLLFFFFPFCFLLLG